MTFVVGLTGGIASGKTTVANIFHQQFGIELIDADIVAREVVAIGSPGLNAISQQFGPDVIKPDGSLDRAGLRQIIFSDPNKMQWLNELLHPMIRDKMHNDIQQATSPYALLVVPLLVENKLQSMADRILVVDVDEQTQIERTMARDNVSLEQVQSTLNSQASRTERLSSADDVIENHTKSEQLLPLVTELHKKYLAMSTKNR